MKKTLIILIGLFAIISSAQTNPQPIVSVAGEGVVRVVPDEVTISVRVENTGTSPAEVKKQNDRIVNEVFSFVKKMKIETKDVRTQYVQLSKNYEYNTKTYNYVANQSIAITLRDLLKYEELMSGLLSSGINRIDGVSFSNANKNQLEADARKKAVANAKMKAEEYASVLNQSIGKAISISEFSNATSPPPMYKTMAMDMDSSGSQQTIAPGEMEIRVTVNVNFILN